MPSNHTNALSPIASYQTIKEESRGQCLQQRSRFLSFLYPIKNESEAMSLINQTKQKYYNARHVCWAYRLGAGGEVTRSNDDGEPSGTAGRPILGQITRHNLTQIVAIVVRYFGGIKLGSSGLIDAYQEATEEAIRQATIISHRIEWTFSVRFDYQTMGRVMALVKDYEAQIIAQEFLDSCSITLSAPVEQAVELYARLEGIYGTSLNWINTEAV